MGLEKPTYWLPTPIVMTYRSYDWILVAAISALSSVELDAQCSMLDA